jgi:hypothetical protein
MIFVKALIGAPDDREPAVRKLIEGAGGKVISYYVTTTKPISSSFRKQMKLRL